jgi:hypothetical protein
MACFNSSVPQIGLIQDYYSKLSKLDAGSRPFGIVSKGHSPNMQVSPESLDDGGHDSPRMLAGESMDNLELSIPTPAEMFPVLSQISPQAANESMRADGSQDFGISSKKEGHPSSDTITTSEPDPCKHIIAPPEEHGEEVTQLPKPPKTDGETTVSNEGGESPSGVLSSNGLVGEGKELGEPPVDRESVRDDGSSTLDDNPEMNCSTILMKPSTPSEGNHEGSKEQSKDLANAEGAGGASVDSEKQESGSTSVIAINGSTIHVEPLTASEGNHEGPREQCGDLADAEGVSEDPEKDGHRTIGRVVTDETEPSVSMIEGNNEESSQKPLHSGSSATDKESVNGDEEASKEEGRIHDSVSLEKSGADATKPTSPSDEHSKKSEEHSQSPPAVAPSTGTIGGVTSQNEDSHKGGCCGGCIIC